MLGQGAGGAAQDFSLHESLLFATFFVAVMVVGVAMTVWEWYPEKAPRRMRKIMEDGAYPASGWMLTAALAVVPWAPISIATVLYALTHAQVWRTMATGLVYVAAVLSVPALLRTLTGIGSILTPPRLRSGARSSRG